MKQKKKVMKMVIEMIIIFLFLSCTLIIFYCIITEVSIKNFLLNDDYINVLIIILFISSIVSVIDKIFTIKNSEEDSQYRNFLLKEIEDRENSETIVQKETEEESESETESKEILEKKSEQKDILMQMLKNNDETTDYFKISKRQAQSSFWFSIIACIIGIIMICLSLYAVFEIKDTEFAIIGIVGGTITELIAGTVLVIHNKSALQLNYYYDALHENEKILSAINLADKLENTEKTQMYIEIIKSQIRESEEKAKEEK